MPSVDASGPCQRAVAVANAALEEALRAEAMAEKARLDQAELKDIENKISGGLDPSDWLDEDEARKHVAEDDTK